MAAVEKTVGDGGETPEGRSYRSRFRGCLLRCLVAHVLASYGGSLAGLCIPSISGYQTPSDQSPLALILSPILYPLGMLLAILLQGAALLGLPAEAPGVLYSLEMLGYYGVFFLAAWYLLRVLGLGAKRT